MIYLVQLEPLEERYTEQWSRWIPEAFDQLGENFSIILGEQLTTKIESGYVLDSEGTNYYKFQQLKNIMSMIRDGVIGDGDTLLFYDLWFPGLEAIAYSCAIRKIKINIVGVMHAGTYDVNDFTYKEGMRDWGQHLERAWFEIYDAVFVGSDYHRDLLIKNFPQFSNKIHTTLLPIDIYEIGIKTKDNKNLKTVVFPHRLDKEKQPELFDKLVDDLKGKGFEFIKTMDVCKSKKEYYKLLHKADIAVSFSLQETYGIAMLEAYTTGCYCLVPNRLSYKSLWNNCYKSYDDLKDKLLSSSFSDFIPEIGQIHPNEVVKKWLKIINNL